MSQMDVTKVRQFIAPRNARPFALDKKDVEGYRNLSRIGIEFSARHMKQMHEAAMDARAAAVEDLRDRVGMDAAAQIVTQASIGTPVQFLQSWLTGFVRTMTVARKADDAIGLTMAGNWYDEEIVQGILEGVGIATPYGDKNNTALASYTPTYERRTIVRFEMGFEVGPLEEARAAAGRVNSAETKRSACGQALELQRNLVAILGYNGGAGRTYGFLNDPILPAYVSVATGASGQTTWASKTYLEILADIRVAMAKVQTQSFDNANPEDLAMTLLLPTNAYAFLSVSTSFGGGGGSVRDWFTKTYPKLRIVSLPQLNTANGGAGVFYLFVDSIDDESTDDGRTFDQYVQTKTTLLGVAKKTKGYEEAYVNATAGSICKRPLLVVRYTGIS